MKTDYYSGHRRYVLCFDVPDNRRRAKLVKCLRNYGARVQRSVFEAVLDHKKFTEMETGVMKIVNPGEDSFFAYHLCANCEKRVLRHGRQIAPENGRETVFVV